MNKKMWISHRDEWETFVFFLQNQLHHIWDDASNTHLDIVDCRPVTNISGIMIFWPNAQNAAIACR